MQKGNKTLRAIYFNMALVEIGYGNMIALLPLYLAEELGFSIAIVGLVIAVYSLAELLSKTPSGWLADRMGRRPVLLLSILLITISFGGLHFAKSLWLLLPLVILGGIGVSAIWPISVAVTADQVAEEQRGQYLGLIGMICLAGKGIAPAIGSLTIHLTGRYYSLFTCNALLSVLALLLTFFFVKEPQKTSVVQEQLPKAGFRKLLAHCPMLLTLTGILFLQSLGMGIMAPIVGLYAKKVLGFDVEMIGPILLLPVFAIAGLTYLTGKMSDRIGRKKPLKIGLLLLSIAFFLVPLSVNLVYLTAVTGLLGLGYALLMPAWTALVTEESPAAQRGVVLGAVGTMQGLGLTLGPLLGTQVWNIWGAAAPFYCSAIVLTLGTVVAFWRIRGKD